MPLHLLGKKSWNVYNADNIARVHRDEADARSREAADEERMQEEDSARRLAILRGEEPPPLKPAVARDDSGQIDRAPRPRYGERRPRKRTGEDDTDFEMRVARERAEKGQQATAELSAGFGVGSASGTVAKRNDAPIVNRAGHISLFGEEDELAARHKEKNPETEKEEASKRRELEDQCRMRFVNAAGRDGSGLTGGGPWYAKGEAGPVAEMAEAPSLNAFGREDPGRKARDSARMNLSDPLAVMRHGAAMVRSLGIARKKEMEERERDLKALRREEKAARKREKERRRDHRRRSSRSRSPEKYTTSSYRYREDGRDRGKERGRDRGRDRESERHRRESSRRRDEENYESHRLKDGRHRQMSSSRPRGREHEH